MGDNWDDSKFKAHTTSRLFDGDLDIDKFLPKTVKDCEQYAVAVATRYILGLKDGKNYKLLLRSLIKEACQPLSAADSKEVEVYLKNVSLEKMKKEEAKAKSAPRGLPEINAGCKSRKATVLDEYRYDDLKDLFD